LDSEQGGGGEGVKRSFCLLLWQGKLGRYSPRDRFYAWSVNLDVCGFYPGRRIEDKGEKRNIKRREKRRSAHVVLYWLDKGTISKRADDTARSISIRSGACAGWRHNRPKREKDDVKQKRRRRGPRGGQFMETWPWARLIYRSEARELDG